MSIAAIKSAVSLPVLVGEWVNLRQVGTEHTGLCPFHSERTPSLRVHAEYFKCFGCGAGGDCFTFVSMIEAVPLGRAIALLSQRTGIPLDGSKRRTPIQRAGDRQDLDFALWWHGRQVLRMSRQLTAYCIHATEEECEDLGSVLRQLRSLNRQSIVGAARRMGTAEDWRGWEQDRKDAVIITQEVVSLVQRSVEETQCDVLGGSEGKLIGPVIIARNVERESIGRII